jgi:hypothetical protein
MKKSRRNAAFHVKGADARQRKKANQAQVLVRERRAQMLHQARERERRARDRARQDRDDLLPTLSLPPRERLFPTPSLLMGPLDLRRVEMLYEYCRPRMGVLLVVAPVDEEGLAEDTKEK